MKLDFESEIPIYIQIAEALEDGVLSGGFPEETQVPSTTELSVAYKINPATDKMRGHVCAVRRGKPDPRQAPAALL